LFSSNIFKYNALSPAPLGPQLEVICPRMSRSPL
jgi:hypothetical protein